MTAPLKISKARRLAKPPRTAMEVYELLPDSTRSEVFDNALYMPPSPSFEHGDISISLAARMRIFCDDRQIGKLMHAPSGAYFDDATVFEPDIFYIPKHRLGTIQNGKIKCIPDLIIEILSPGNRNHDLVRKFELYQQFGVPEYIIIDPPTKEVIHYVLQEGVYQKQISQNGSFYSQVLQASFSF